MKGFLVGGTVVVILWLATPRVVASMTGAPNEWTSAGQFGDQFGALNALFSGLAFVGLIYAIRQQSEELQLQRRELQLQRDELKLQREEMTASRQELAGQVLAQRALVGATSSQIFATAGQVYAEAIKLASEGKIPGARGDEAAQIRDIARQIEAQAQIYGKFDSAIK